MIALSIWTDTERRCSVHAVIGFSSTGSSKMLLDMELHNVAPFAASKSSSSRFKRKMEHKVGSGRTVTVDEGEFAEICHKAGHAVQCYSEVEAMNLLQHLFQIAEEHREEGWGLQRELESFEQELKEPVDKIWKKYQDAEAEGKTAAEGREKRMQVYEKRSQIDPMDTVARPGLVKQSWNTQLSMVGLRMSSRK